MSSLRVGVLGAGSVGCFVGGRLLTTGVDVVLVGRERIRTELAAHGLTTTPLGGRPTTIPAARVQVELDPAVLATCDVVLVCVKSGQTAEVAQTLGGLLPRTALVVSLQNGVQNAAILREGSRRTVLAGVVGFNVVSRGEGRFRHTTQGDLLLQDSDDPRALDLFDALRASGLGLGVHADLAPHQWVKLLVNLNNAVSALSGAPTAELILNPGYRKIVRSLMAEGLAVLRQAKIPVARLRGVPIGALIGVLRLPTPAVRLMARAQLKADPEARSSMWEDLTRGRTTEVDLLNGEIVRVAQAHGGAAPLNQRVVEVVHEVEAAGAGCPKLSPTELRARLA